MNVCILLNQTCPQPTLTSPLPLGPSWSMPNSSMWRFTLPLPLSSHNSLWGAEYRSSVTLSYLWGLPLSPSQKSVMKATRTGPHAVHECFLS